MALSEKQKKVIDFALENDGQITKDQAMVLINDYYCNGSKHVGDVLSRMVKSGILVRVKRGVYNVGSYKKNASKNIVSPNQLILV